MLAVLTRIAIALEAPAAAPVAAPVGCQHPERYRVTFGLDEFECRACGYRSPELVARG